MPEAFEESISSSKREPYFAWTEALSCGDQQIDVDHQYLLSIASRLGRGRPAGAEKAMDEAVIEELISFTRKHFDREETLMRKLAYPGFDEHRFEHELMLSRVGIFQRRFIDGDVLAMSELRHFLRRWLRRHIMTVDLQLARFITG
jgi:hemerythrin